MHRSKNYMKYQICCLASVLTLTATALATPLQKELISADAKWLVHLDLDALRDSRVGKFLNQTIVENKLAEHRAELKQAYGFDLDITKLNSITAYGTDYKLNPEANGVLIIGLDPNMQALLGLVLDKQVQSGVVSQVDDKAKLYSIHNQVMVSFQKEGQVFMGKSKESLQKAMDVLAGKAPNLASGRTFAGYPDTPKSFFFLALAEGFSGKIPLPHQKEGEGKNEGGFAPKAQLLQMADGGRLVLGESADNLFLNLSLKAKTVDASRQMQQILQGVLALVSLSQGQNQDLLQIVQATKISSEANVVNIGLDYPVAKAMDMFSQGKMHLDRAGAGHSREGSRREKAAKKSKDGKQAAKPEADDDAE
jgi:hypothetical protein